MEKLRYKVIFIVTLGALALLGPILSSETMSNPGLFGVPKAYFFILLVWLGFILISGWIIQKSKW